MAKRPENSELVPAQEPAPLLLYQQAIEKGVSAAELQGLLDLHERIENRRAEKAFNAAMIAAQADMPVIFHDSKNMHTKSTYASLERIQREIKPIYQRHGFTLSWGEASGAAAGFARIICHVSHAEGFTRTYQGDFPLDGKGAQGGGVMNALQGRVSANTYAQRDLIRSIFNLTIQGADEDGNQSLSDKQVKELEGLLAEVERVRGVKLPDDKMGAFWAWIDAPSFEAIPAVSFIKARDELARWLKKAKEAKS